MQQQPKKSNKTARAFAYIFAFLCLAALVILPNKDNVTDGWVKLVVQLFVLVLLFVSLQVYIYYVDRLTATQTNKVLAMLSTMVLSYALIVCASYWQGYGLMIVPFAFCSMVIAMTLSSGVGFFANFVVILLYFLQMVNFGTSTVTADGFYLLISGIIEAVYASYVFNKHSTRIRYLATGVVLGFISAVCLVATTLMFSDDIATISAEETLIRAGVAFASGLVGVMIMFVIVPLFERMFNVVSVFRFSEIASSDTKLMRRLYEQAPGTYNHSMTVAIYAEACAVAIGESPIMARAAAYYHDVGKLKNPPFFAENQLDARNPHDNMTPENSVSMIKAHTEYGLAIAKEYKLPKEVQNVIVEHHGTMPIKFFYLKAKRYTDGDLSYEHYRYDGPKPTSKISAIIMICDSSEAALRAHGDKTRAEEIVDEIVSERLTLEQFSDCDLTLKEIDKIKSTIITTYSGIRHKRVKYPQIKLTGENN